MCHIYLPLCIAAASYWIMWRSILQGKSVYSESSNSFISSQHFANRDSSVVKSLLNIRLHAYYILQKFEIVVLHQRLSSVHTKYVSPLSTVLTANRQYITSEDATFPGQSRSQHSGQQRGAELVLCALASKVDDRSASIPKSWSNIKYNNHP